MNKLLTIAIPTYNRSKRLEKSLNDLLAQINKSKMNQYLSVFVSNNGSTDLTAKILDKYNYIFKQNNIPLFSQNLKENQGFDANVLNCYRNCDSEYIWFLSDDDNIMDGAISSIIEDIKILVPSVLYYNFNQEPYTINNPYIIENNLYEQIDISNIQSIIKIIKWPKLTSLIIRKTDEKVCERFKTYDFGFMHIAIAIQVGLDFGKVFHSNKFIAHPDDDYLDHINFPPFIGNNLIKTVYHVLDQNDKLYIYQHIKLETVNPLTSSLINLAYYYRGKFVLTPELKSELYLTIVNELKTIKFNKINMELFLSIIRLFIGYTYNVCHYFLTGKSATRVRTINQNI